MKFCSLKPETWDSYLAAHRAFDGLWVFQHVPKTAGSSVSGALAAHATPHAGIDVDRGAAIPLRQQYRAAAASVPLTVAGRPLRSLSGHLWKADVDLLLQRDPSARLFTFLRDPVARVVSDFRYARSPAHDQWEKQIADYPDLDAYIEASPAVRNKTAFFLTGQRDGDPAEIVPWVLARFDYIGLLEEMALSHGILSQLLRMGQARAGHHRSTSNVPANDVQPSPDQLARILRANALDRALFDRVAAIHRSLDTCVPAGVGLGAGLGAGAVAGAVA